MAEKQSVPGRMSQLLRANIAALIDRAADPEKMLDQIIRDYTGAIAAVEDAVAQTIGDLRLAQHDYAADVDLTKQWGAQAGAAAAEAKARRASGDDAGADRFDDLARLALGKQVAAEQDARAAEPFLAAQTELVDKLKKGLAALKDKLSGLRNERAQLVARARSAAGQTRGQDAIGSINIFDPAGEVSRFAEQMRRQEAIAHGAGEVTVEG